MQACIDLASQGVCCVSSKLEASAWQQLPELSRRVRLVARYLLHGEQDLQVEAMGDAGQPEGEATDAPAPRGAWIATAGKEGAIPGCCRGGGLVWL